MSLANMWTLLVHERNQQQAMQRAAQAQAQGLDPGTFGVPFPGGVVTTTTTNNTGISPIKAALVSAALLAGGAGGTLGLIGALSPSKPVVTTPAPAPATPAPTVKAPAQAWDAITEEQLPDGSWREIKREHLQPGK